MKIEIGKQVFHKDVYDGREQMTITGIRKSERKRIDDPDSFDVELEGDWSGGTHNVCQRSWIKSDGLLENRADQ